jgi:hypothetical protein
VAFGEISRTESGCRIRDIEFKGKYEVVTYSSQLACLAFCQFNASQEDQMSLVTYPA